MQIRALVIALVMFLPPQAYASCTSPFIARMNAAAAQYSKLEALIKKGNCSYVDEAMTYVDAYDNACKQNNAVCSNKCHVSGPSLEGMRADLVKKCSAANASSRQHDSPQRSVSCENTQSTITDGPESGSSNQPAAQCKLGNNALNAARSLKREHKPNGAVQDEYKKAARAFKLAGDLARAQEALNEAAGNGAVGAGHADSGNEANTPSGRPMVPSNCLLPPVPRELGSMFSSCPGKVHEWVTHIRASKRKGCPKTVDFTYRDPETGKIKEADTTLSPIQTCGGPATDVRPK